MRRNLNFLVSELGPTQQNYFLIRNINRMHDSVSDLNIQVFTENLSRFCMPALFGVMSVAEAWGQAGPFVATNLSTAAKLINYPLASHKIFYVWDLEFLRSWNRIYDYYAPVYTNPEIKLVARSKEHADLIENSFNKEVQTIVENFNIEQFLEITK